ILSPYFASGTESGNNFTSALALSRGSMVSGADNLGKGVDRIWGRTRRCFCPTCGTRGEEKTSSSLLRARASLGMLQRLLPHFFSLASIYFLQAMDWRS